MLPLLGIEQTPSMRGRGWFWLAGHGSGSPQRLSFSVPKCGDHSWAAIVSVGSLCRTIRDDSNCLRRELTSSPFVSGEGLTSFPEMHPWMPFYLGIPGSIHGIPGGTNT